MYKFNFNDLSKYRTQLMGVATLLVVWGHSIGNGVIMPKWMEFLCGLASVGVDIFLFVSGLGLWYSLRNIENEYTSISNGLSKWYIKRYKRILLPYFIIIGFHYFLYVFNGMSISQALFEFSTFSFWINHRGAWFIAMLIPIYAITPFHDYICRKTNNTILYTFILISFIITISSINYKIENLKVQIIIDNVKHVLFHLPAFYIGFMVAPWVKKQEKFSYIWIFILSLLIVFVMKTFKFGYWPGFLVYPFMILFCWLFHYCKYYILRFFSFFGKISLESYLFNGVIGAWIIWYLPEIYKSPLNKNCYLHYSLICVVGTILAYFVNKLCGILLGRLKKIWL